MPTSVCSFFSQLVIVAFAIERTIAIARPFFARTWCTIKKAAILSAIMAIPSLGLDIHGFWFYRADIKFDPKLGRDEVVFSYTDLYFKKSAGPIIRWIDLCFLCLCLFCMFVANILLIRGLRKARKKFQNNGKNTRSLGFMSNERASTSVLGDSSSVFTKNGSEMPTYLKPNLKANPSTEKSELKGPFERIGEKLACFSSCFAENRGSSNSPDEIKERWSSVETISSQVYLGPVFEKETSPTYPGNHADSDRIQGGKKLGQVKNQTEISQTKGEKNHTTGQDEKVQISKQGVQKQAFNGKAELERTQGKAFHDKRFGTLSKKMTPDSPKLQHTKNAIKRLRSQRNKEKQDARITRLLILIIAVYAALYIPLMVRLSKAKLLFVKSHFDLYSFKSTL